MDPVAPTPKQMAKQVKQNFKQLNIRQFSTDLLVFNNLIDMANKNSDRTDMKIKFDDALIQNAKHLRERYPIERYNRKFIDTQLKIKIDNVERRFDLAKRITVGITYTVMIGGAITWLRLHGEDIPSQIPIELRSVDFENTLNIIIKTVMGGAVASLLAVLEFVSFDHFKKKYKSEKENTWSIVWNVFDKITNFKNVGDLRKPYEKAYTYSYSIDYCNLSSYARPVNSQKISMSDFFKKYGRNVEPVDKEKHEKSHSSSYRSSNSYTPTSNPTSSSSSISYPPSKPFFDPNKDNRFYGSPLGPGFTNAGPG